ncbi:hypothetical protein CGC21_15045 [Leishmania donovani]|uniref:Protein kinase domain family protein n=1 Tax=Leishmania donovani TaxID=5661 RepID=A0A504XMG3_LEIDO|nr:hypothetical protein CGC21_15045 [Leishmania donovani]
MGSIIHEAPRVREAVLENPVQAFYIVPRPPYQHSLDAHGGRRLMHGGTCRNGSPRQADLQPLPPAARKTSTTTHLDSRSAFAPVRPLNALPGCAAAAQRCRYRSPRSATEREAAAAANQTLARLQAAPPSASLRHDRQAHLLSLEAWQPLILTAAPDRAPRQPVASVSSPQHSEFSTFGPTWAAPGGSSSGAEGLGKISLRWQLRRGDRGAAPFPPTFGEPDGRAAENQQHPLQILHFLGAAAFNDSPLCTFLPCLSLRMASSHASTTAQSTDRRSTSRPSLRSYGRQSTRARRSRSRAETLAVHLGDVEARTYRVEVPQGETSPLQPLLKAYPDCVWDGSEFLLLPLLDEQREPSEVLPSAIAREPTVRVRGAVEESDTTATTDNAPLLGFGREAADEMALPGMTTFLCSANASFGGAGGGGTALDATPPPSSLASASMGGGGSAVNSMGTAARNTMGMQAGRLATTAVPVVPRWKRFSVTAALYLALGDAGCCDVAHFPYAAVQLCGWDDLVGQQRIRIEAKASCSAAAISALEKGTHGRRTRLVPVAVMFPVSRKGVMRRPLSLTTQPFTDAEVFQLFYLQLLFRAYFDVRFRGMTFTLPGQATRHLRSDLVAARSSGGHHVAFEHPTRNDEWLLFPAHTRLLTLLNLEEAVVPLYATPAELQETSSLPLFGAGETLPCLGVAGRGAAQWATTVEVSSPETAVLALAALFDNMKGQFGCTRGELWRRATGDARAGALPFAPLLFRCAPSGSLLSGIPAGDSAHTTTASSTPSTSTRPLLTEIGLQAETFATMDTVTEVLPGAGGTRASSDCDQDRDAGLPSCLDADDLADTKSSEEMLCASKSAPPVVVHLGPVDDTAGATSAQSPDIVPALVSTVDLAQEEDAKRVEVPPLRVVADAEGVGLDEATTPCSELRSASSVGPLSPCTKWEGLITRWRHYIHTGDCAIFTGATTDVEVLRFLGRGGSGLVYSGTYGSQRLPVAVKVFVIPEDMDHEQYVRESLTDVAFYVLLNQLEDFGVCYGGRAHDFIVSQQTPKGLPAEAAAEARRGDDGATTKLCYLVTDLMDGTLGRFLTEQDADFDPLYDQLLNSPLRDGELFQFLFIQLAAKMLFDWKVLDMMLNNQLRGDNIGYRYVARPPAQTARLRESAEEAVALGGSRQYHAGILYGFQFGPDESLHYLRFPAETGVADYANLGPLRFICIIDVGQGMQPNVEELVRNRYIGETVLESCIEDDGFGRYWPLNELYCRYVDVEGTLAKDVAAWGSARRVTTKEDAFEALRELFDYFYPTFGIEAPTEEELHTHLCFSWTSTNLEHLKAAYVYRGE